MIRAGHTITIKSSVITSNQGFLLAPAFNVNGLTITPQDKIPDIIKEFLQQYGCIVNRVKLQNELLVRITGEFILHRGQIEKFLEQHQELTGDQSVVPAIKMYSSIKQTFDDNSLNHYRDKEFKYTDGKFDCQFFPSKVIIQENFSSIQTDYKNSGSINMSGKDIVMFNETFSVTADFLPQFFDPGTGLTCFGGLEDKTGFMAEVLAVNKVQVVASKNILLENAVVSAGGNIELVTDQLRLTIDRSVEWVNNPLPDQFTPFLNAKRTKAKRLVPTTKEEDPYNLRRQASMSYNNKFFD